MLGHLLAIAISLCAITRGDQASGSALSRFTKADQSKIVAAADAFVRHEDGTYWDRSVFLKKQDALSKPGASDREKEALGISGPFPCDNVPLWYAARFRERLASEEAVASVAAPKKDQDCIRHTGYVVCNQILSKEIALCDEWVPNSKFQGVPGSGNPNEFKHQPGYVAIRNHKFTYEHERVDKPFFRSSDATVVGSGPDASHYRTFVFCTPTEATPVVAPVTGEQLAAAILDGKAMLTEWRWERKQVGTRTVPVGPKPGGGGGRAPRREQEPVFVVEWIARDATPTAIDTEAAKPTPAGISR